MNSLPVPVLIGMIIVALGIRNMKGDISSLHRYNRKRVSEEDRLPFGRKVGAGTVLVGCSVILKACFEFASEHFGMPFLDRIGTGILIAGLAAGLTVITIAMFRYNKGLF